MATEDLWHKVDKNLSDKGCWIWTRFRNPGGYGVVTVNQRKWLVHRYVWTLSFGEIPTNMLVCHSCDNPACCNPDHLFLGTQKDNIQDMWRKNRDYRSRGKAYNAVGQRNGRAILTEEQAKFIKSMRGKMMGTELAKQFNVSNGTIYDILKERHWRHL